MKDSGSRKQPVLVTGTVGGTLSASWHAFVLLPLANKIPVTYLASKPGEGNPSIHSSIWGYK